MLEKGYHLSTADAMRKWQVIALEIIEDVEQRLREAEINPAFHETIVRNSNKPSMDLN